MTAPESGRRRRAAIDQVETWIFDLDNTLYRVTAERLAEIDGHLTAFVAEFLSLAPAEARVLQKHYFRHYGLTLRGLMLEHGLEPKLYFDYMHEAGLCDVPSDPSLAHAIGRLQGRKIVYTNAWGRHADEMLARIGLTELFDAVHDIVEAKFVPKPAPESFAELCRRHGIDASSAAMIDDIQRNLEPAAAAGAATVWCKTSADWAKDQHPGQHVDHVTEDLCAWLDALPGSRAGSD